MLIKDSVASYEYDTNGNLTKMQGIDWWVAYQYDYENRLVRVTDSNGMDVAYKYDPMGRRIEKNVLGLKHPGTCYNQTPLHETPHHP